MNCDPLYAWIQDHKGGVLLDVDLADLRRAADGACGPGTTTNLISSGLFVAGIDVPSGVRCISGPSLEDCALRYNPNSGVWTSIVTEAAITNIDTEPVTTPVVRAPDFGPLAAVTLLFGIIVGVMLGYVALLRLFSRGRGR